MKDTDNIIDAELNERNTETSLEFAISWWERKRIPFNIIVGITGLVIVMAFADSLNIIDNFGIILYGLIVNAAFTLGFLIEALDLHYFKGILKLYQYRKLLFLIGTILSVLITGFLAYASYELFDKF